ncbi:MAG: DUF5687 family protein, partial [Bacteroidales bacterium]|nr:DUF5687 family protein [Bacteroidales bacterium]
MNTLRYLISHQWKATRRAPMWQQNLVVNILLGLAMLYMALSFLALGFFADTALRHIFPDRAPVDIFNTALLYYFGMEILFRLFMQSLPSM